MKCNLLGCGLVAGPLFIAASLTQAFTRKGFDLARHPISLLSLGALGWVQIANFVVCGTLYLLGAAGMRQALGQSRGGTWGPLLIGVTEQLGLAYAPTYGVVFTFVIMAVVLAFRPQGIRGGRA